MSLRLVSAIALSMVLALPGLARAFDPGSVSFEDVLAEAARGGLTVPAAWSGIWDITDTTRTCGGAISDTDASADTLCTGDDVTPDDEGFPGSFNCTGSVNDTTVDIDCTGIFTFPPDCTATLSIALDGTRTGETYVATSSLSIVYSGGATCNIVPDQCSVTTTHGTRIAPQPADCTTPVAPSSWGQVKSYYR